MGRFKSDIYDLIDMNFTKSAAAKRAGCSTSALDKECMRVFGKGWADLKEERKDASNLALAHRPAGKFYYAHTHRILSLG